MGDYSKAINLFDEIETQKKDNLVTQFLSMNIFPIIYESTDQIEIFRKRFIFLLKKLTISLIKKKLIKQRLLMLLNLQQTFIYHIRVKMI